VIATLSFAIGCGASYTREPERPKVVVLNIKGAKKAVRGDIVELLKSEYPLIPKADYIKTARRLKAKKLRARHISKVSTELGVSAVVSGRVKRRGKRRYLYVTVHDGASGARIERFRVRLTSGRALTKKGSRQLSEKLTAALSELKPIRPVTADGDRSDRTAESDDDEEVKKAKPRRETRAERRRRKKAEAGERKKAEREEKRRAAAEAKRAERERERAEREREQTKRDREIAERERKKREARDRAAKAEKARKAKEARERAERQRQKREAAEIKRVANPKTDDEGQAIDDESPF
jgi:hypothetical protein